MLLNGDGSNVAQFPQPCFSSNIEVSNSMSHACAFSWTALVSPAYFPCHFLEVAEIFFSCFLLKTLGSMLPGTASSLRASDFPG